jgi:hypothetical protein
MPGEMRDRPMLEETDIPLSIRPGLSLLRLQLRPVRPLQKRLADMLAEAWPSAMAIAGFTGLVWILQETGTRCYPLLLNLFTFLIGFGLVQLWIRTRTEPRKYTNWKLRRLNVSIDLSHPMMGLKATAEVMMETGSLATLKDVLIILNECVPDFMAKTSLRSGFESQAPVVFNVDKQRLESNLDTPVEPGENFLVVFLDAKES